MQKFFVELAKAKRTCSCGKDKCKILPGEKHILFFITGTAEAHLRFECASRMFNDIYYVKVKSVKYLRNLLDDGESRNFTLYLEEDVVSIKSLRFVTNKKCLTVRMLDQLLAPWRISNWSDNKFLTEEVLTDEEFMESNIVKWIKAGQFYLTV